MFDSLSDRLQGTIKRLRGQSRLTEENVQETIREVRKALLEADVALPVVREFIARVKERAVGQEVLASLTPGQALVKVVNDELIAVMGDGNDEINLNVQPPAVILMAGLQGAGKTTTVGKLSRWLAERKDKKVMVASCDVYRPAAIRQLQTVAGEVGADFFPSDAGQDPVDIAKAALEQARKQHRDVLIIDTAGRLHVDAEMMDEIRRLHEALDPAETLFVVDSMTGQDAANTAKAFNDALPLTGVVLTKADGDARGGAALSVRHITGKPIKFLGMGEKTTALEPFHPDRVASRILGMGDVVSLVEEATRQVDQDKAEKLARKIKKGKSFDLEDLRDQLGQMSKMGGVNSLLEKLPGTGDLPDAIKNKAHDKDMGRMVAIINSMTPKERRHPEIIKGRRKRRIAAGSGTQVQDVNRLLKQHMQMSKMVKQFSKGGMNKMMKSLKGRMPGGRMPF
ncbi:MULTISPECIES: signal recognition particle protein [Ectothiorhodospira]|uniref:signal recognition particle protein n=1 Tax=Ectothiorhodospira TaxID=1051 RepID=UPI00047C8BAB|nr:MULTISPECIES: signal recognition particle protein [Ectothiorhodospira]MCG5495821.1 signal recognition particle protein [Ectothiorhodospira variabilis]MCG5498708.1 signal recognition particle protein [Ectothiorhodospira variabilis]MCG5504745.1 signal recognition particle protein [Ectothiorhodospira variabilis]MCG5507902.1 signal recognition particle protein [Ectothiorhodospira variabilis]MCG5525998.1 signal recognition particle protein [Ectothiorhodospira haloalkaliphila]